MGIAPTGPPTGNLITIPDPAAGANFLYTVPAKTTIRLISVYFSLATDLNAADRHPEITFDDAANVFYYATCNLKLTNSKTYLVCFGANLHPVISTGALDVNIPISPNILLPAGYVIRSRILNVQAADQISGIRILTERYVA